MRFDGRADKLAKALHRLKLICVKCEQEKTIIVDSNKPSVEMNVLRSDGKVRVSKRYPTHRHPLYCSYHIKEVNPIVGKES